MFGSTDAKMVLPLFPLLERGPGLEFLQVFTVSFLPLTSVDLFALFLLALCAYVLSGVDDHIVRILDSLAIKLFKPNLCVQKEYMLNLLPW